MEERFNEVLEGKHTVLAWDDLKRELGKVEKPARYSGGEINAFRKKAPPVDVHFALAFPDVYEVGMSHLGSHILYSVLNSRDADMTPRDLHVSIAGSPAASHKRDIS